jgi:hypothetical protein
MRQKKEQEQLSGERHDSEKPPSLNSAAEPAPIDDGFARRAGEIIARATGGLRNTFQRRGKRK